MKRLILLMLFLSFNSVANTDKKYDVPNEWEALHRYGSPSNDVFEKSTIHFLVWNIHKEVHQLQWKKDYEKLSQGKDIILLQEFTTNLNLNDFPPSFGGRQVIFGESFSRKMRRIGNVSLSIYQSEISQVFHSIDLEPIIKTPKSIVKTVYRLQGGDKLMVFNVHGINFKGLDPFKRYLQLLLWELFSYQGRAIIAGDFNSWSKQRLKFMNDSFESIGFKAIKFKNSHLIKTWRGNKLDHIFQRGLNVVSAEIPIGIKSSDHAPMVFTLESID